IPDIVHANDWQTGLVPVYVAEVYRPAVGLSHLRSVFTVHNIAYQGMFPRDVMQITGLPGGMFNHRQLEFHGYLNFMKAGIVFADAVNTVSPTYAREIQTAEFGCGLEGLLAGVHWKLSGIVNGCDYEHWDPSADPHIATPYTAETVFANKPLCKADMQRRFHLPEDPKAPVLGMIARLVSQKGIDLVMSAAPGFLDLGCQMVILGDGDREYHDQLQAFRDRHPERVGIYLGFNEPLAHVIEAGA